MITETMGVEQVDMRYTQPEAAPILPRTAGEMELDNLPAIETSTARVDGQDFASNLVKQNESGADETRLNMEKKLLWEGIRRQLKLKRKLWNGVRDGTMVKKEFLINSFRRRLYSYRLLQVKRSIHTRKYESTLRRE